MSGAGADQAAASCAVTTRPDGYVALPKKGRKAAVLTTLTVTRMLVSAARCFVPSQIAQGVLTGVNNVLAQIQSTVKNQYDFLDLARRLQEIVEIIERTGGKAEVDLGDSVVLALAKLGMSLEHIHKCIEEQSKKNLLKSFLSATIDRDQIIAWHDELGDLMQPVSLQLQFSTYFMAKRIHAMIDDIIRPQNEPEDVPSIVPPARPPLFIGRDEMVADVVEAVLDKRPVALLGVGGIGKTCIAKAVLHEELVVARFGPRRFFVRCDGVVSSKSRLSRSAFLNCVVDGLGLKASISNLTASVISFLKTSDVLLILDNAEIFLDDNTSKDDVSELIDELGAISTVSLLLTSRSSELSVGLAWDFISVSPLSQQAALTAFTAIFRTPLLGDSYKQLKALLKEVDHHPLSINLLAQVGIQNQWTIDSIAKRWRVEKLKLLSIGNSSKGKSRNLEISIAISLNSPSILALGSDALYVLRVIAWLPQGMRASAQGHIFLYDPETEKQLDVFLRHSLIYRDGKFLNMLSPVRLYFDGQSIPENFLATLQEYVWRSINGNRGPPVFDHIVRGGLDAHRWIREEDVNAESVMVTVLNTYGKDTKLGYEVMAEQLGIFWDTLMRHKPRPLGTTLEELIRPSMELLRQDEDGNLRNVYGITLGRFARTNFEAGLCRYGLNVWAQAQAVLERSIHPRARINRAVGFADRGRAFRTLGHFARAEALTRLALSAAATISNEDVATNARLILAEVLLARDHIEDACIVLDDVALEMVDDPAMYLVYSLARGYSYIRRGRPEKASECYALAKDKCKDVVGPSWMAEAIAGLAMSQQNLTEALQVLSDERARNSEYFSDSNLCLLACHIAFVNARDGRLQSAADELQAAKRYLLECSVTGDIACNVHYVHGQVALLRGELSEAQEHFLATRNESDMRWNLHFEALSARALGEIAMASGDTRAAHHLFEKAQNVCVDMGINPRRLYEVNRACVFHRLSEDYIAWEEWLNSKSSLN